MGRKLIAICLILCFGCTRQDHNAADDSANEQVEDGGRVENPDRDKAEEYFVALGEVRSAEEEEKLLTEFGDWSSKKDYQISVREKSGTYELSCPHFPPVTPWTEHEFYDIGNLNLLPQRDDGG